MSCTFCLCVTKRCDHDSSRPEACSIMLHDNITSRIMVSSFQHHPLFQFIIPHHTQPFSASSSITVHHPVSCSAVFSIILQNSSSSSIMLSSFQHHPPKQSIIQYHAQQFSIIIAQSSSTSNILLSTV